MDRTQAEREFMDQCFQPAFRAWTQREAERYGEAYAATERTFLADCQRFLELLAKVQGQVDCTPAVVTLSMLWTSLLAGEPALLMEAHLGSPFVMEPMLSERIPVPWLYCGWEGFVEELQRRCGELALGTYLRSPEVRTKALEGARSVLVNYCMMMKAHLRLLPQTEAWKAVRKGAFFCVTAGEYMERQLPLAGERAELDLVYLEKGGDARFARFEKRLFQSQRFEALNLMDTVFEHCTFRETAFCECALVDARFVDCTFERCEFSGLSLMGAEFHAVRLTETSFDKVWTRTGQSGEPWDCISCGRTSFTNCLLERVAFQSAELLEVRVDSCQFIELRSLDSALCEALPISAPQEG